MFTEFGKCPGGGEFAARVYRVGQWDPESLAWVEKTVKLRIEFTATDGSVIKQLKTRRDDRDREQVKALVRKELAALAAERGCKGITWA